MPGGKDGSAYSRTTRATDTRGDSKQNSRASNISGLRSLVNRSRACSQPGPTAGIGSASTTSTTLVAVTVISVNGPSTTKLATGLP
jgi:hypothetical protein